jgi:hypothetical protein
MEVTPASSLRVGAFALAALLTFSVFADPAADFNDGKTVGNTLSGQVLSGVKSGSAASTSPNHTATPPQSTYYGRTDLSSPAAAERSACSANPSDPRCAAVNTGVATRPREVIVPSDPALAADSVTKDPSQILGDISTTYSACATTTSLITPATFATQTCTVSTGSWTSNPCLKTLDSVPVDRMTCTHNTLMSAISTGAPHPPLGKWVQTYADVKCDVVRNDGKLTFQLGACMDCPSAWPMVAVDIDITTDHPAPSNPPPLIAQIPAKYGLVDVYEEGPACTGSSCQKKIHFFVPGGYGNTYSCPPTEVHGPDLRVDDGFGTWIPLLEGNCYTQNAGGQYALNTLTGLYNWYLPTGPATVTGWTILPGSAFQTITLDYKRPYLEKLAGDYWDNTCAPFEAKTPPSMLPPDGVNKPPALPLMPVVSSDQCQRVSSVCVDGPSTKIIDGHSVTRECWQYAKRFDCATLDASSTCNTPPLNACAAKGPATCSATDSGAPPHCVSASMQVECKVSDPVYGPVTNCGTSTFCPNGTCWDQALTPDPDFAQTISMLEAAKEAGKELDPNSLRTFSGTGENCHSWPLNCCTTKPLIPPICPDDEKQLADRRDRGLCHEVESGWCSSRVLGVCVQKKNTYCCFKGKLSRIVNEQGRPQIAKGWGTGKDPICTGFLVTELQMLDFAAMDLSEFYADIKSKMPDISATQSNAVTKSVNCYYGAGKC